MKFLCLGDAGRICREAILDLVQFSPATLKVRYTLWHTHPPSDGSVPDWAGLRAYTRNVGIPLSIGAQLLAQGKVRKRGVITPEEAFDPDEVITELRRRQILIHTQVEELEPI